MNLKKIKIHIINFIDIKKILIFLLKQFLDLIY